MANEAKYLGVTFQSNGSFTSYTKHVYDKLLKRMNVSRYLKGTNWGAVTAPLLSIYRCLIRPILEYGMDAYFSVSEHAIGSLQKIQNLCLRLCTGATKNTPTLCLQNHCNEMPLKLKYKYLCLL